MSTRFLCSPLLALVVAVAGGACGGDDGKGGDGGGQLYDDAGNPIVDQDGGNNEFPNACKKVDVIIAVDNSGSMSEEKAALANEVFPAMATRLLEISGGLDDFRVGVLDACPNPANYHTRGLSGECNFSTNDPWMSSFSPNLQAEFQCVGDIDSSDMLCAGDSSDDDEQPALAAATSMQEPWLSGANEGFLRNDAVLVVMAITDEDEELLGVGESVQELFDRLVAAKGDVKRMVFLGVGGGSQCQGVYGSADPAYELINLTNMFIAEDRGVFWDLCVGELEDGLEEAMQVIQQACDEFEPIP